MPTLYMWAESPTAATIFRAAEAVELPNDNGVPLAGEGQSLLEAHSFGTSPAGGVGEDPLAPGLGQGVVLEVELGS